MPYILIIDKTGVIKETNIKEYKEEDLHKKANFKSAEGFALQTTWSGLSTSSSTSSSNKQVSVSVYGKKAGKAGQENKYEFPPPIDSVLFFGGCVLVAKSEVEGSIVDLRVSSWNKMYDTLMGGFEDLDLEEVQEGEDEEEEDEDVDPNLIGKNGYMKDGFVVEDDDVEFEEDLVEEEEEEADAESEEEVKPKKKPKRKPAEKKGDKEKKKSDKDKKKKSAEKEGLASDISVAVTDNYLDCSSELVEEAYV
jgi:hypothetical protein